MRVYLAAPYAARNALRQYAEELTRFGHECTSSWLAEEVEVKAGTVGAAKDVSDTDAWQHVKQDLRDIRRSHALIVWSWLAAVRLNGLVEHHGNSGGRHVETGVALQLGLPIIIIGQPENIFHRDANPGSVDTWHEACMALAELERKRPQVVGDVAS